MAGCDKLPILTSGRFKSTPSNFHTRLKRNDLVNLTGVKSCEIFSSPDAHTPPMSSSAINPAEGSLTLPLRASPAGSTGRSSGRNTARVAFTVESRKLGLARARNFDISAPAFLVPGRRERHESWESTSKTRRAKGSRVK